MPAFQDPETYRNILDGLGIGESVLDLQNKICLLERLNRTITGFRGSLRPPALLQVNELS
jgi:hypothetical protein